MNFEIKQTRDYGLFKYASGNRKVNPQHVRKLTKSVQENGQLPTVVIVNPNYEIIDGQHRFECFRALGLPIMYMVADVGKKEMIAYNAFDKNWNAMDYAISYSDQGNANYTRLIELSEEMPLLTISSIVRLISIPGDDRNQTFKSGKFKINQDKKIMLKKMYPLYQKIHEISPKLTTVKTMLPALMRVAQVEGFDQKRLLHNIKFHLHKITPFSTVNEAQTVLHNIYNFHRKDKLDLRPAL